MTVTKAIITVSQTVQPVQYHPQNIAYQIELDLSNIEDPGDQQAEITHQTAIAKANLFTQLGLSYEVVTENELDVIRLVADAFPGTEVTTEKKSSGGGRSGGGFGGRKTPAKKSSGGFGAKKKQPAKDTKEIEEAIYNAYEEGGIEAVDEEFYFNYGKFGPWMKSKSNGDLTLNLEKAKYLSDELVEELSEACED